MFSSGRRTDLLADMAASDCETETASLTQPQMTQPLTGMKTFASGWETSWRPAREEASRILPPEGMLLSGLTGRLSSSLSPPSYQKEK